MKRFLTTILLLFAISAPAQPRCWEGEITIPTYPWGEDINPKFQELEGVIYYPYPLQDVLSSTKEDRTYKALFLENEYLQVTCLPELGGRIHSVLDKTTGQEMFHKNNVIKPGLIGLRGAWIAGGIEWNTGPHGHTVTIVSPVDAMVMENEGGSVSLVVGNTEKIFRTRWTVKVTLHPGRSYLEEDIRIFNPTDGVHPYYFWNCTAFPCLPGTRFIFPMSLGCDHDGKQFFTWPANEGKDLTWLKNYDRPTSIFAYECDQDFFGAYDVDLDRGIVAVADHHVLPGKKAWTWGQSDDGRVSQQALTDEDGPYIEVQSGPLRTQADYGLLYPREEVRWQEWWYPVHGLGQGFEYANKDVAVETVRTGGGLELRILATCAFPDSTLVASQGDLVLFQGPVNLSPNAPVTVKIAKVPEGPIKVALLGDEFFTPLPISKVEPPAPSWRETKKEDVMTVEELYLMGQEEDKKTNRSGAREWYHKALAKDASHVASLRSLAVLDLESGLYEEASDQLREALERDPGDRWSKYFQAVAQLKRTERAETVETPFPSRPEEIPVLLERLEGNPNDYESHYYLGNLLAGLNRCDEAVPHWGKAAELNPKLSVPLRNLGLYAWKQEKDLAKAQDYYRRAIEARPSDDTLYRDLARILVEDGKRPEAIEILESYPLERVRRNDFVEDLGKYYAEEERYDDAIALLEGAWFSNWEGRTASHNTWVKAHLERGKKCFEAKDFKGALEDFRASLTYPEQLGVGRPAEVEEAERLYWVGMALSELGNYDEALSVWMSGADGKEGSETQKEYREKCKQAIETAGK